MGILLHYDRIDLSEGIDVDKSNKIEECKICHHSLFNYDFKYQDYVCNGCHIWWCSDIAIIIGKNFDYPYIIYNSISDAIHLLENSVLETNTKKRIYNHYFYKLVKAKKLETENILINEISYKDLTIYFTSYVYKKLIKA